MRKSALILIEQRALLSEKNIADTQQAITTWLTTQLNTLPTKDACTVLSAQAFQINSCQTAAHKV